MASIDFRNKKLYSTRTDTIGWFYNQHGRTRQTGLSEFENFKSSYTPGSNVKILLENQYFISTRHHSAYGHSVSYETFGRSNISSYPINESYTYSDSVCFGLYTDGTTEGVEYAYFSPLRRYRSDSPWDVKVEGSANLSYKSFNNGPNEAYRTKFYFKKIAYDRF